MSVQTASSQPFSMFSRGNFGLSSRSRDKKAASPDEDWYIPYNGPYEAPKEQPRKQRARDSWGFPVDEYEEDDSMLADRELHLRYGGHHDFNPRASNSGGGGERPADEERKGRSRDRTFSVISGRTTSSGAMDPNRGSLSLHRRSTVSGNPPPVPSYINLDAVGGVGESPMPHTRQARDTHRISLASIFSFGAGGRKAAPSPNHSAVGRRSSTRLLQPTSDGPYGVMESPAPARRDSSSSGSGRPSDATTTGRPSHHQADQTSLIVIDEEDYYNSYYETLLRPSEHINHHPYQSRSPSSSGASNSSPGTLQKESNTISRQNSTSTTSAHPYAYAFPRTEIPEPHTAPPTPAPRLMPSQALTNPPRLTFIAPQPHPSSGTSNGAYTTLSPQPAAAPTPLKNSTSTPDFRTQTLVFGKTTTIPNNNSHHRNNNNNSPTLQFRRGFDRWLSAETWCDALLFPRPRLRIKQEPVEGPLRGKESSGRIVSPPLTPTGGDESESLQQHQQATREPGIASRVLAHSRSMVDLHKGRRKPEDVQHAHPSKLTQDPSSSRTAAQSSGRPPRPKSFAQDDLALLPTPVPSLAHVLREGELLASERREWQRKATQSFGNKRARSMSRSRAKSLTQKGRQGKHSHQSSMEYIAARACLGTQDLTPIIAPPEFTASFSESNATTTTSSGKTHSHTNSLVKTLTKSSKAHSRTHSRNDSWSKNAMKAAKSTVICGFDNASSVKLPHASNNKGPDLEGALTRNETKVIRLADPAMLPIDRGQPSQPYQNLTVRNSPSPANSGISESKVGIALGTPPEEEAEYMPSHPYAQGGLSFSHAASSSVDHPPRHTDFAGPHPSINTGVKVPNISDIIARHKLPPHMVLHPYAQRDSYLDSNGLVGQFRSEDSTPHGSKMWAQLSPGVVREILPHDLQYSPFSPDHGGRLPHIPDRQTIIINDTVGVGETLVNAARFRAGDDKGTVGSGKSRDLSPKQQHQQPSHVQLSQPTWAKEEEDDHLAELNPISRRNGIQFGLSQSVDDGEAQILRVPSFDRTQSASSGNTSATSSPRTLPQPLGSPNDLENFQDLFYRPTGPGMGRTPNEAALPETPSPPNRGSAAWDMNMPNRRTGSSLTSLARKLSEEFEMLSHERERSSNSQYSQSPPSSQRPSRRQPTDGSLQFVFEEMAGSGSPGPNESEDPISAFRASGALPEDVQPDDSRASSYIENTDDDDDPTARFHMGVVESVSTPPAVSNHHVSFDGQMAFVHDDQLQRQDIDTAASSGRILSSLMPPTEATRSSYMTTSTISRMSGLSDFPAPPKDEFITPKHMSILSSYFDEALTQSESRPEPLPPPPMLLQEDRVTFGGNQDARDLAQILSSDHSSRSQI